MAGEEMSHGTRFSYEVHNSSAEHSARIELYFSEIDPGTGSWRKASRPVTFVLRPGARYTGSALSPSPDSLPYEGLVLWDDEPGFGDSKPDEESEEPEPPAPPPEPQTDPDTITQFETDQWGSVVIPRHLLQDHTTVVDIEFIAEESDSEGAAFVAEFINNYGANKFDAPDAYGRVISINGSRVHGFFHGINLARSFGGAANNIMTVVQLIKITRLSGKEDEADEEEPAMLPDAPKPSPTRSADKQTPTKQVQSGKLDTVSVSKKHEGYWYDPSDKEADEYATDPIMYVRYLGKAHRMLLSKAKSVYGVPHTANVGNMTHYKESQKAITENRGTHRAPQKADQGG
jgi:hypothetical protein